MAAKNKALIWSIIAGLLGGGLEVSGYTNLPLAIGLWAIAGGLFLWWLWHYLPENPFQRKFMGPLILFFVGLACVGGGAVWYFMTASPQSSTPSTEKTAAPKGKPQRYHARPEDLEFHMLLIREFENASSSGSKRVEKGEFGQHVFVEFVVMHRVDINAEFYVVYIPPSANAEAVAQYVLNNYQQLRDELAPSSEAQEKFERQQIQIANPRLPFTGKIFLYHEANLSEDQQTSLQLAFKEKGVVVEFRGPEYVADLRIRMAAFYKFKEPQ